MGVVFLIRTSILNKGIKLIAMIISELQAYENKNERQSYDCLPLSTLDNSVLELFYKDLHLLCDLKNAFDHEGIDNYVINSSIS